MNKLFFTFIIVIVFVTSCTPKEEEVEIDPYIYKHGELVEGEILANALMDEDIDNPTVYKLVNKLDEIYDLRHCQPADSFMVKLDTLNVIHELKFMPDRIHAYRVLIDSTYEYYTEVDTLQTYIEFFSTEGEIDTSLWQGMMDAGGTPAIAMLFTQIFQWDIDFFIDPQKGDKFKVICQKIVDSNGEFVEYGSILAAQYSTRGYDKIAYLYQNKKGTIKYYDETGKCFQKAFLKSPLNYTRITSKFGIRVHPVTKKKSIHNGVDYGAARGTPVEATADGVVIKASWNKRHTGETVKIRHSNGYITLYGHLSKYGKYKVGDRVQQHDIIGYVGSTGRSTGPHLHYTIYHHGTPINPLKLKNVSGPAVPKNEKEAFNEIVEIMRKMILESELENKVEADTLNIR